MAIVITAEGNLAKVVTPTGVYKYFNILAMPEAFSLDTSISPIGVSSRTIDMWDDNTGLNQFTIAGHSGMTTVGDFDAAMADLSKLST